MPSGYLAIVAAMLIWGSVGIFARWGGQPPQVAVLYRVVFAALAMGTLYLLQRPRPQLPPARQWWLVVLSGVAVSVNWLFFFKALAATTVSNAVLSYYTSPALVALVGPLLLRERFEMRNLGVTALAFAGVFVMLYSPGGALSAADVAGISYGLLAACFYAMVVILARWLSDVDPAVLVLAQMVVASLVLLPVAATVTGGALLVPFQSGLVLAVIGLVHTALALYLYFKGLRTVDVQHVGVLAYLDPVSAVAFAWMFLGEQPALRTLAGGGLVLLASWMLMQGRPKAGKIAIQPEI